MKSSIYTLIALWLWCVAAAGEKLPVTIQSLQENDYRAILTMPCDWDKNIDTISVNAVYANPGNYTAITRYSIVDLDSIVNVPIEPLDIQVTGNQLTIQFDPEIPMMHESKYLYHINVDVHTQGKECKSGFGFNQPNFTR